MADCIRAVSNIVVPVASLNAQPRMASIITAPGDSRVSDVRFTGNSAGSPTPAVAPGPRGKYTFYINVIIMTCLVVSS